MVNLPRSGPPGGSQLHATANVRAEAARRGATIRDVCSAIGMARSTWSRRVKDPGTWRLEELRKVAVYLEVPLDRLADGIDQ